MTQILTGKVILPVLQKKLSKLRYYLKSKALLDLYYALVYPFLTYCVIAWGNTYQTSLQPLFVLQKEAIKIITFF